MAFKSFMTLVAMATNFETKSAISPKFLRLVGFFGVGLLNDVRQIIPLPTPVDMTAKFQGKSAITKLV